VFEPANPSTMLVGLMGIGGSDGGIWRTTNALAGTPSFVRTLSSPITQGRIQFAINKIGSVVTVLAGVEDVDNQGASTAHLQKSADGGQTWSLVPAADGFCTGQCFYDMAVALDPNNANIIYLGGAA